MASFTAPCPKPCSAPIVRLAASQSSQPQQQLLSFHNCLNRSSLLQASGLQSNIKKQSGAWKVQALSKFLSFFAPIFELKVTTEKPSNSAPINNTKSEDESAEKVSNNIPDASSISAFMAQVSDLVKLVDSRDIVELQMKQLDLELVIRKKEALEKPAPQAPFASAPPPYPYPMQYGPPPPAPAAAPAPASPAPAASAPALPAPAKPAASAHPPLKCPMAGTFYRCPAPGEPPFVKARDKVQKGQVICIIEAMKLMNEIEADQSGTIVEVLAEDTKPVSVDTPLFVIAP
ncbi:biotin carboxyl carrier protein of acetyl-CoA carboxylase 2, chloroplastic isoform X2 [Rosa rugosa]|uniref:biotin carboxyl carrier protein of acetyl-CoA carboxylase 2, chloroplastic isoform X2 n=1 Tax=Rosa rugosa TaxID=74645 RepID=UPI002B409C6F|nr:biotin carboxyl carrier protein of acetyl-CoA carboxylase 2, chloroplastic isoform X2 [Rosa rugosa]